MLTLYVDCYSSFQLLLTYYKIANLGNYDGFPSLRFVSALIKALGLSFMDSLVLLNVQQQKRQSLAAPCCLTTNKK